MQQPRQGKRFPCMKTGSCGDPFVRGIGHTSEKFFAFAVTMSHTSNDSSSPHRAWPGPLDKLSLQSNVFLPSHQQCSNNRVTFSGAHRKELLFIEWVNLAGSDMVELTFLCCGLLTPGLLYAMQCIALDLLLMLNFYLLLHRPRYFANLLVDFSWNFPLDDRVNCFSVFF